MFAGPTTLYQQEIRQSDYKASTAKDAVVRLTNTTFLAVAEVKIRGENDWGSIDTSTTDKVRNYGNMTLAFYSVATCNTGDKLVAGTSATGANEISSTDLARWMVSHSIEGRYWTIKIELDPKYISTLAVDSPTEANTVAVLVLSQKASTTGANLAIGSFSTVKSQQRQPN